MSARVVQLVWATHVGGEGDGNSVDPVRTIYGLYTFDGDLVAQWSGWADDGASSKPDDRVTRALSELDR